MHPACKAQWDCFRAREDNARFGRVSWSSQHRVNMRDAAARLPAEVEISSATVPLAQSSRYDDA